MDGFHIETCREHGVIMASGKGTAKPGLTKHPTGVKIAASDHSEVELEREPSDVRSWPVSLFVIAVVLGLAYVALMATGALVRNRADPDSDVPAGTESAGRTTRPTRTPKGGATAATVLRLPKIGIVAGHWQSDSGAVCPDGLEEVTINLDVASRVVAILQSEGYEAELLPEFSESLVGYQADAFVSIHTDSCDIPAASGFKVARVAGSAIPEEEDRLVACLRREYHLASGLSFHENSITFDMTLYHAFGEIDPMTPGAIIELGFMDADRELLIDRTYELAQGVARGIACFFQGE